MYLCLAGMERWWKESQAEGVRLVLMSYHNMRKNLRLPALLKYLQELRESSTDYDPSWVMLDSGVFSLRQSNAPILDVILDKYADSYIDWVSSDAGDCFSTVVEIDLPQDTLDPDGEVLIDGYDRVKAWRERLYKAVGRRLMPVLMIENTWEEKEEVCKDPRFDWVALPSFPNDMSSDQIISLSQAHISLAHKYGKKIHLFAQTNVQTNLHYLLNCDSCDSTTWISGDKHGMTFIFEKGRMTYLFHDQKYRRTYYKGYFGKIGCDWKKILGVHEEHWEYCDGPGSRTPNCDACSDQLQETRRSALIAWKKYQRYLITRDPRRRKSRLSNPIENKSLSGKDIKMATKVRKRPKGGRVYPKDSISIRNHQVTEEFKIIGDEEEPSDKLQNNSKKSKGGGVLLDDVSIKDENVANDEGVRTGGQGTLTEGGLHDQVIYDRGVDIQPVHVSGDISNDEVKEGENDGNNTARNRQDNAETKNKSGTGSDCLRRNNQSKEDNKEGSLDISHLGDSMESNSNSIVSVRKEDEDGRVSDQTEGTEELRKEDRGTDGGDDTTSPVPVDPLHLPIMYNGQLNLEKMRTTTAGYMCDTCSVEESCPVSEPGSVCRLEKQWDEFDSRRPDDLRGVLEHMIDLDKKRTLMALHMEQVQTGGVIDKRVSEQLDGFMRRAERVMTLQDAMDGTHFQQSPGTTQINAQNVNVLSAQPGDPGMFARIFGGNAPTTPVLVDDPENSDPNS